MTINRIFSPWIKFCVLYNYDKMFRKENCVTVTYFQKTELQMTKWVRSAKEIFFFKKIYFFYFIKCALKFPSYWYKVVTRTTLIVIANFEKRTKFFNLCAKYLVDFVCWLSVVMVVFSESKESVYIKHKRHFSINPIFAVFYISYVIEIISQFYISGKRTFYDTKINRTFYLKNQVICDWIFQKSNWFIKKTF